MKDFVDDLYRRASEDPDIPFNELAWERMEHKLAIAERKRRGILLWFFFSLLFVLSLGLIWGIQTLPKEKEPNSKEHHAPIAKKSPLQLPANTPSSENLNEEQLSNAKKLEKKIPSSKIDVVASKSTRNAKKNSKKQHSFTPDNLVKTSSSVNRFYQQGSQQLPKQNSTTTNIVDAFNNKHNVITSENLAVFSNSPENELIKVDSLQGNPPRHTVFLPFDPLVQNWPPVPLRSDSVVSEEVLPLVEYPLSDLSTIEPVKTNSWGVGLMAGSDLAAVNANGSTAYGYNAGIAVDFRLGRRLVFQASGQYLIKNYIADQREYVAPKGFWQAKAYPYSTEGTCDMLQWNFDVRYNLIATAKWNSFVSLGSSSWTIMKEQYEFYYKTYTHGQVNEWTGTQDKNYWFALAQFGVGVEHTIRPGLSLQLNWFGQRPFQGVGNGNVKIYSSGLSIMVHKQLGTIGR
jgi:hypothetical protein